MTKRYAPATERNREAILAVLQEHLPDKGTILEIASGTGQHAAFFSEQLTTHHWLPTDIDPINLASIESWRQEADAPGLLPPRELDVREPAWPIEDDLPAPIAAIVNINMLHISPWPCCEALFAGAAHILASGSAIILYGPFKRNGQHTAPSNASFDEQLRAQNPEWGVRDLESVTDVAAGHGFICHDIISMPANNLSLVFHRQ